MNQRQPRVERAACACMHVAGKRMQCAELFPSSVLYLSIPSRVAKQVCELDEGICPFYLWIRLTRGKRSRVVKRLSASFEKRGRAWCRACRVHRESPSRWTHSQLLTMTHYPIASDGNESTNAVACLSACVMALLELEIRCYRDACSRELAARSESLESVLLNFSKDKRREASLNYHREINSSNSQIDLTAERRSQSISPPNKLSQEMS